MINLLPQEEKSKIRQEYIVNNISILNIFLFILIIIADVLMASMLLLIYFDNKGTQSSLEASIQRSLDEKREYNAVIQDLNKKLSILSISKTSGVPNDVIKSVVDIKPVGIKINAITYDALPQDIGRAGFIRLDGVASRRNDLIFFRRLLGQLGVFENVDAPVSVLARGEDINFSFRLNLLK